MEAGLTGAAGVLAVLPVVTVSEKEKGHVQILNPQRMAQSVMVSMKKPEVVILRLVHMVII